MTFTHVASWLWAAIAGGGVFVLAVAYAFVLLQRRHARRRALSTGGLRPPPVARARGRAFHVFDLITVLIGVWIAVSPTALGGSYRAHGAALVASNVVFGVLIARFSLAAIYRLHPMEELANALVAVWVGASPWIICAAAIPQAIQWSNADSAAAIIVLSLLGLWRLSGGRDGSPTSTAAG